MYLFACHGHAKASGGFENAREGEVIGSNTVTKHVGEVKQSGNKTAVLDGAGDERGPSDDGAARGKFEDEFGRVKLVKFGVHVQEMVVEEGWKRGF